jgi:hypothetical protein
MFSTVFSTVVEILGNKPKVLSETDACSGKSEAGTVAQGRDEGSCVDTPFQRRLVLTVRQTRLGLAFARGFQRGRLKGHHEGEAHLPAQYPSPQENARLPGTHVDEKWPDRPETAPCQGPEAFDCRRRTVDWQLQPPWKDVACRRHTAFGAEPSSSGSTPAGQRFTADT